jgi:hypothetical protein
MRPQVKYLEAADPAAVPAAPAATVNVAVMAPKSGPIIKGEIALAQKLDANGNTVAATVVGSTVRVQEAKIVGVSQVNRVARSAAQGVVDAATDNDPSTKISAAAQSGALRVKNSIVGPKSATNRVRSAQKNRNEAVKSAINDKKNPPKKAQ